MSFSHFCVYFRFKYTPLVNSTMVYEKVYLRLFGIEKFRGKCFLEHFISNFHIFPYNALQTCHLHIYVYISVSNIYPLVNSNMVYEKGSIYVFLASRSFGESVSQSTLYQIFTFSHIMHCKHVISTFMYIFPFQIYTPS